MLCSVFIEHFLSWPGRGGASFGSPCIRISSRLKGKQTVKSISLVVTPFVYIATLFHRRRYTLQVLSKTSFATWYFLSLLDHGFISCSGLSVVLSAIGSGVRFTVSSMISMCNSCYVITRDSHHDSEST